MFKVIVEKVPKDILVAIIIGMLGMLTGSGGLYFYFKSEILKINKNKKMICELSLLYQERATHFYFKIYDEHKLYQIKNDDLQHSYQRRYSVLYNDELESIKKLKVFCN
jgi:hydroxymethylpyrimidine pyrophosphatase-like HAD family hydrolase